MHTKFYTFCRTIGLSVLLSAGLTFCTFQDHLIEEPQPEKSCKLILSVGENVTRDAFGNIISKTRGLSSYDLDDDQMYLRNSLDSTVWIDNGQLQLRSGTKSTGTFSANGFTQTVLTTSGGLSYQLGQLVPYLNTTFSTYKYKDQRLIEAVNSRITGQDTTVFEKHNYEYAPDGKLAKYVFESNGTQTTNTYSNGILVSSTSNPPSYLDAQYNSMGFQSIAKSTFGGVTTEFRNHYDSRGNLIKTETFLNNVLDAYTEFTVGQANLQEKARPGFKGHPSVPGLTGCNANLPTASASFKKHTNSSEFQKISEMKYEYDFNSSGYVLAGRTTSTNFDMSGKIINSTTGYISYAYTNCQ